MFTTHFNDIKVNVFVDVRFQIAALSLHYANGQSEGQYVPDNAGQYRPDSAGQYVPDPAGQYRADGGSLSLFKFKSFVKFLS